MTILAVAALLAAVVLLVHGRRRPVLPAVAAPDADAGAATRTHVAEVGRLLASALVSGVGLLEALEVVAEHGPAEARGTLRQVVAAQRWGESAASAWEAADRVWEPLAGALVTAEASGLSPVRALHAAAARVERERSAQAVEQVRRLDVLVVLPLGLAFLPGFVLTTVVPIVVGLLGTTLR